MNPNTLAILVVVGVAVIALVLRRGSNAPTETEVPPPLADPSAGSLTDRTSLEADEAPVEVGAFTSDGWAFVPDGDEVQLVPPAPEEDAISETMARYRAVMVDRNTGALESEERRQGLGPAKPGEHLDAGDLIGARVVRGAPSVDPWRLEALGRDGEYRAWAFETEDAARAALNLLERRVVRPPHGDDREPSPPGEADYTAAAARTQAGVAALAMDTGDDEPA